MKKLLLVLVLLMSTIATSQTIIDLSGMTGDVTLGQNCSASQEPQHYVTEGDVNLNGFKLRLKNSTLQVNGNINGGGQIVTCGQSTFCASGTIQNNPSYDSSAYCHTLSVSTFELDMNDIPLGLRYEVYNKLGQVIKQGITSEDILSDLPKKQLIILCISNYNPKKLFIK